MKTEITGLEKVIDISFNINIQLESRQELNDLREATRRVVQQFRVDSHMRGQYYTGDTLNQLLIQLELATEKAIKNECEVREML
jgi:hypothetical protein